MACVGFDVGGRFSVVARVHSRGLTTALNEASKRKSGSLVSIKGKQRFIGCNAEPVARSNYKNTVWYATRLLGRKFSDPTVQEEIALMPYGDIFSENKEDGTVLVTLSYDGEKKAFTCAQCYAMLLGELKRVFQDWVQSVCRAKGLSDELAAKLSAVTQELKQALGGDADMWGNPSRIS